MMTQQNINVCGGLRITDELKSVTTKMNVLVKLKVFANKSNVFIYSEADARYMWENLHLRNPAAILKCPSYSTL